VNGERKGRGEEEKGGEGEGKGSPLTPIPGSAPAASRLYNTPPSIPENIPGQRLSICRRYWPYTNPLLLLYDHHHRYHHYIPLLLGYHLMSNLHTSTGRLHVRQIAVQMLDRLYFHA